MKVVMLMTARGPLVILTAQESVTDPGLLKKLKTRGIEKFIAYEIPLALAEERYGAHFFVVEHDLRETEDFRVLDEDGLHAFGLFRFSELGPPIVYEAVDQSGPNAART